MLFQMWLPYQSGAFALEAAFFVVFLEIADLVSSDGVKGVAYVFAFLCGFGATMGLLTMTFDLHEYIKRLSRAG